MAKKQDMMCFKEAEIAIIQTNMKAVNKVVFGNGKEGLNISVPLLSQTVGDLRDDMKEDRVVRKDMMTTLSAIVKSQDDECLKQAVKEDEFEKREKKRDRKLNVFMAVIATVALLIPIALVIFK